MKRGLALAGASVLALGLLAACGSDEGAAASSPSASASPSAAPIPPSVVWAGDVCVARDNVGAAVAALGNNLSYDVSSDRSALDQIDRQLRIQLLVVGDSLANLGTALQGVPVDFQAANDFVVTTTKAKDDTAEALAALRQHLDAMVNADSIVTGVAQAGQAIVAAKAAFEAGSALVGVVTDGVSQRGGELQEAFDAAVPCQGASGAAL